MARKAYKTARGKKFDMGEFAHHNDEATAVGNMNVNARGDILGQGGHIKKKREEVVREYYHEAPTQQAEVSLKKETSTQDALVTLEVKTSGPVDTFVSPEEAIQTLLDQQAGTKKPAKKSTIKGGAKYAAGTKEEDTDDSSR